MIPDDGAFAFPTATPSAPARLDLTISPRLDPAGLPTLVTIAATLQDFTFRPDDDSADYPIYLPEDRVIITTSADTRAFADIVATIRFHGGRMKFQPNTAASEASFRTSAATNREVKVHTWLGLSRDIRRFRVDENLETFQPKFAGGDVPLPETPKQPATYVFQFGRG
ncbi:MAG: hypothetical protein H7343_06930 [Undibacterium sp.]|nr:hypothetical protein [Opitutaceae bacterium]